MSARAALALLGAVAAGCGDNHCEAQFELPAGQCWSIENTVMKGELILGMGELAFEPIGDELPLLMQGQLMEPHIIVNIRIRGLQPGDPNVMWGDPNPRTRIVPYFEDTGGRAKSSPCPFRVPFAPVDAETFGMPEGMGIAVPFDNCWTWPHLLGRRIILRFEMVDACGSYALAEHAITLVRDPNAMYPPEHVGLPGCPE